MISWMQQRCGNHSRQQLMSLSSSSATTNTFGRHLQQQQQQVRCISTESAMRMLGFSSKTTVSAKGGIKLKELRTAYFELAKRTHPDLQNQETSDTSVDFRDITEAYEHLLQFELSKQNGGGNANTILGDDVISKEEEEIYREACLSVLGISAEIVEESKQNPMFRHWLGGNTDGAQHWRAFFSVHGGLAQKLRAPAAYLEGGGERPSFENRRRRGKR